MDTSQIEVEVPVLAGYLNREYGYNGYKPIPKGTPVFEFQGRWFFVMELIHNGELHRQWFRKDSGLDKHFDKV